MVIVRDLVTRLGFQVDRAGIKQADSGFKKLQKAANALTIAVGAVGIGLVGALGFVTKSAIEAGDEVAKSAAKIGLSVEALQELRFAAEIVGVNINELDIGLRSLQRRAADAAIGNEEFAKGFRRVGVTVTDAEGRIKPTIQLFKEVAEGMKGLETQAERTAVAMRVAGDSGFQLNNLFSQGAEGIERLQRRARALGFILNSETTKELERVADAFLEARLVVTGLTNRLGAALAPALEGIAGGLLEVFTESESVQEIFKEIRDFTLGLSKRFVKLGVDLKNSGIGLKDLVKLFKVVTPAFVGFGALLVTTFAPLFLFATKAALIIGALTIVGLVLEDLTREAKGTASVLDQLSDSADRFAQRDGPFAEAFVAALSLAKSLRDVVLEIGSGIKEFVQGISTIPLTTLTNAFKGLVGPFVGEGSAFVKRQNAIAEQQALQAIQNNQFVASIPDPVRQPPAAALQSIPITVNQSFEGTNLTPGQVSDASRQGVEAATRQLSREFQQRGSR